MSPTTLESTEYEYETKDGAKSSVQFKTTVPKELVNAMGWDGGDTLEWGIESGNKLSVSKQKE